MKKMKLGMLMFSSLAALSLASCGGSGKTTVCEEHVFDEGVVTQEPTCGNVGYKTYTCVNCKTTKEEIYGEATGSHSFSDGKCTVCGYIDMSGLSMEEAIEKYGYYHLDSDSSRTLNTMDTVYFGSYPSSLVSDSSLESSLKEKVNEDSYISYNYSVSNQASDCMMYQDIEFEGKKYRALKISSYRPYYTDLTSENSFISQNGYKEGSVYFFRFEPIRWSVLDHVDGKAVLHSVYCIDGQSFADTYTKEGSKFYVKGSINANDYENSYIREFLNHSFYDSAFSESEKSMISKTLLDNANTSYSLNNEFATVQNSTEDNVYLLSYQDMLNSRYQFPNVESKTVSGEANGDVRVCKSGTDYALSQGLRLSNQMQNADGLPCSFWLLRSAGGRNYTVCGISKYGTASKANSQTYSGNSTSEADSIVFYTAEGIAPAVTLNI